MGVLSPDRRRVTAPEAVDQEVAAATFELHLTRFFRTGRGSREGWQRIDLDPLHSVIRIPATRPDGSQDHYFVQLGAEYYDVWPPTASFVRPEGEHGWGYPTSSSRWWPKQQNSPGFSFGLHHDYGFPGGSTGQLLCFSHTFEYYISNHNPTDAERWRQGTHTVSATLTRIAAVLTAPNYQGPSGDLDS
jgi:hypothetical protein